LLPLLDGFAVPTLEAGFTEFNPEFKLGGFFVRIGWYEGTVLDDAN
jgi:hypothetical protein